MRRCTSEEDGDEENDEAEQGDGGIGIQGDYGVGGLFYGIKKKSTGCCKKVKIK
jgi:hypothetical protein